MPQMQVAQVTRPNTPIELVKRDIPKPGPGQVLLKVHACGVCHSDMVTVAGALPIQYPRVPGHEVIASPEPIQVAPLQLIFQRRSIQGWPSGTSADSEDTLSFSVLSNIRPMIETYPLSRAAEAYERMMSGKARFRVVITPNA